MLDIKMMFLQMANREGRPLKSFAPDVKLSKNVFYNKIGVDAGRLKISVLENMLHTLGYRLGLQVFDENGVLVASCVSEPDKQLVDSDLLNKRRDTFSENIKEKVPKGQKIGEKAEE